MSSPAISEVYWKGIEDINNLEGREMAAFMTLMSSIFRTYETFFFEAQEGRFESQMYDGWMSQLKDLLVLKGIQQYWAMRGHHFSNEFVEHINKMSAETAAKPLYPQDA